MSKDLQSNLLQELDLRISYINYGTWDTHGRWSSPDDEDQSILRASLCYAKRIMPALQDIERLDLHPLLQTGFELLRRAVSGSQACVLAVRWLPSAAHSG